MITMAPPFVHSDFDVIRVSDAWTVRRIVHSLLNSAGREGRECRATARAKKVRQCGRFPRHESPATYAARFVPQLST
jgi:hypothetical protein